MILPQQKVKKSITLLTAFYLLLYAPLVQAKNENLNTPVIQTADEKLATFHLPALTKQSMAEEKENNDLAKCNAEKITEKK